MNGVEKPRPVPLSESDFEQIKKIGEAAGVTADQINDLAYAVARMATKPQDPITYTNRAARRARARAERKNR